MVVAFLRLCLMCFLFPNVLALGTAMRCSVVIISGQTRTLETSWPHIKQTVIEPLQSLGFTIMVVAVLDSLNHRSLLQQSDSAATIMKLTDDTPPLPNIKIMSQAALGSRNRLFAYTRMLWHAQKLASRRMRDCNLTQSVIVRQRPDIHLIRPIPTEIRTALLASKQVVFMPKQSSNGGINDRFAIGSALPMMRLLRFYETILDMFVHRNFTDTRICRTSRLCETEGIFQAHLVITGVNTVSIDLPMHKECESHPVKMTTTDFYRWGKC